jgi:hypothetical protein
MADPAPPTGGDLAPLLTEIRALKTQIKDLSTASGTQRGQVRSDLVGRVSYFLQGNSFQSWTTTQADDYPFGSVLTFTLEQPRAVSFQFLADVGAAATISNTSSSAGARIYTSLIVDSIPRYPTTSNMVSANVNGGAGRATAQGASTSATASARLLLELPAGEHTVQGCLRQRRVDVSGAGAGNINVDGYQLFVDVLQTVA